jgi:ABC-type proline/glycine betaine transport system substrate-binding protein
VKLHILFPLVLAGCSLTAQDRAVLSANTTRDVASVEHDAIESFCIPRYEAAQSVKEVDAADKLCLPARASYLAVKLSWGVMVNVLQAEKAGTATEAQVEDAARQLGDSFSVLKEAMGDIK